MSDSMPVSTTSQETHNPRRTVPLALLASLAICTALYVLIALMITGLADYHALNVIGSDLCSARCSGSGTRLGEAAGQARWWWWGSFPRCSLHCSDRCASSTRWRAMDLLPKMFVAVHPRVGHSAHRHLCDRCDGGDHRRRLPAQFAG